ncbi:ribonuclease HII [Phototrophicus methaneseepsis]|uniref:Ribonuclease HII n=1 Tax=Phototrophicus methaneseepsis TaxID=2710758 RepID=A0A7S8IFS7_9CHLR|nr:ribonuclease HII [Phototrophicus methaneseepsis]QPC85035.1 ribonuclease HII [Phototrophicus methaneseepsis]
MPSQNPEKMPRRDRTASLDIELAHYEQGYHAIVGIDEAGRGPWAGPLTVGAVALPLDRSDLSVVLKGVRDSKMMTPRQREGLVETIKEVSLAWGIGEVDAEEISIMGLTAGTRLAANRAMKMLMKEGFQPDCLFCDYMSLPDWQIYQLRLVKGDQKSLSIAAASVLAKVTRDAYMIDIAEEFPHYGFEKHKGYGTAAHRAALEQYGPCPLHRKHYRPIRELLDANQPDGAA